jgi:hypothetical protein
LSIVDAGRELRAVPSEHREVEQGVMEDCALGDVYGVVPKPEKPRFPPFYSAPPDFPYPGQLSSADDKDGSPSSHPLDGTGLSCTFRQ